MKYPKYIELTLQNIPDSFVTDRGIEIIRKDGTSEILTSFKDLKTLYPQEEKLDSVAPKRGRKKHEETVE